MDVLPGKRPSRTSKYTPYMLRTPATWLLDRGRRSLPEHRNPPYFLSRSFPAIGHGGGDCACSLVIDPDSPRTGGLEK
ncbi:uncharacterized protein CIMG_12738 [Coccidioides immitis RS]|uniref:Uncharacterized protein n=1 Tax=Coccidioides immitis (strain RS) TaxID=246410 RepID=J3KKD1_COCIM|nr:uncharacterized protein CIMG_12738 [Coccidioides immitis RS]EAS36616.3 hypothetical protein CIMG_12738 [Coccidioides immitis RS]